MAGLWRAPHLSLFLLAAVWAALVPLVWLAPRACDPLAWHRQELVLGFAGAAMGGYLLSALPHWLKQAGGAGGVPPRATVLLVLAWLAGRLAGGACLPDGLALAGQALYPVGLALCLAVPVARTGAWSRLPIALAPLGLVLVALRLRLDGDGLTAVLAMALLVALVGGRIVPAFLAARAGSRAARPALPRGGRLADLVTALALALHLGGAPEVWTGAILLTAALAQALRMLRWTLAPVLRHRQGDLLLLLVAWLWLPLGLALVGAALAGLSPLPLPAALHALTMGLMGGMILAVMARSWMIRAPGRLQVGRVTAAAFLLVQLAAALRLALPDPLLPLLAWSAGWTLATLESARAARRPVPHPVLSARRRLTGTPPPS